MQDQIQAMKYKVYLGPTVCDMRAPSIPQLCLLQDFRRFPVKSLGSVHRFPQGGLLYFTAPLGISATLGRSCLHNQVGLLCWVALVDFSKLGWSDHGLRPSVRYWPQISEE
jgi:hypothetical protein